MFKKLRSLVFNIICSFYVPHLFHKYCKQIKSLPDDTQLFFMTRMDLGTHLFLLHYAKCWKEKRGNTCIVVLTGHFDFASRLAPLISLNTKIISSEHRLLRWLIKIFGARRVHYHIFNRVYSRMATNYPNALYLFDESRAGYTHFVPHFDKHLQNVAENVHPSFVEAYKKARRVFDFRYDLLLDLFQLHHSSSSDFSSTALKQKLGFLKQAIKIETPYVILNINSKDYKDKAANRRTIVHFERYNVIIDRLIELGYTVVIQGRYEQPPLQARRRLVDYAKSDHPSAENDLALFSGSAFAILPKTGPELFALITHTPVLGLNYTEWAALIPNVKSRFFYKHIKDAKGRFLHWKEILASPSFFDMGNHCFGEPIEYEEMSEEELVESLEEFLPLTKEPLEKWTQYTPYQKAFKQALTPLHLDLYYTKGVPCDSYLKKEAFIKN